MNLSFKILGYEVATVSLDFPASEPAGTSAFKPVSRVSLLDRGVKWMSDQWVGRMLKH